MKINHSILKTAAFTAAMIFVLVLTAAGDDHSDKVTEEFHHTYSLPSSGRVHLENINGSVHITAWDRNEVKVDAVKSAYSKERLDDAKIVVDANQDHVSIHTEYPDHNMNYGHHENPASVEYTLMVPRDVRLDHIELVNGGLDITGAGGEVDASCVNGNLKARGLSGRASLSTVNGHADVGFDRLGTSAVEVSSVNGSVELTLPSNAKAELEASTVNGGIGNDFGLQVHKHRIVGSDMRGQLAGGGTRIKLSDVNGRIEIRHAKDNQALSPAKDLEPSDSDDSI
jgi:DUF4097 and DUF4098 domain-containing protein YvlB